MTVTTIFLIITLLVLQFSPVKAEAIHNLTICQSDDRRPSSLKEVARMVSNATENEGCTATLVSPSCLLSARHCYDYMAYAQFNVSPDQNLTDAKDIYAINQKSIVYSNDDTDWLVAKLTPNNINGKRAGDIQGWLKVQTQTSNVGDAIEIAGYGTSSLGCIQQIAFGSVMKSGIILDYNVDTMPGNSGSSIVNSITHEIIGIHTHGGCTSTNPNSSNHGTAIAPNNKLKKAIADCIDSDNADHSVN